MLTGAGLGDDAGFAHPFGQQALAKGVVDFVGAGMRQIFAFEVNLGTATMRGEAGGVGQGGRTPDKRCLELA